MELRPEQFAEHVGELGYRNMAPLHAEDLYLSAACKLGLPSALDVFDRAHIQPLESLMARLAGNSSFADDVLQDLRKRLLMGSSPRIGTYRGEGSLRGWVRAAAVHLAADVVRRERAQRARNLVLTSTRNRGNLGELHR